MNKADNNAAVSGKDDGGIHLMTKKVDKTTYDVFVHFSKTSKEKMTDKILRLIRNEKLK